MATVVCKAQWRGKVIRAKCDNMAVVATIKSGSCREKVAMHLRRCLAFVEASVPLTIVAEHIRGVENTVADALSRNKLEVARSVMQPSSGDGADPGGPGGAADQKGSLLVRAGVEEVASFLLDQGLSEATRRRYDSTWRRYSASCEGLKEVPLPVTEEKATVYVATLACGGMKAATVKFHLAGLRQAHIRAGLTPPEWGKMARLAQTRRGLERYEATDSAGKLVRHPVKWQHMRALRDEWGAAGEKGRMLWAAACLCFFACLRAGEALAPEQGEFDEGAHLTWRDVEVGTWNDKETIRVNIKQSKTDRLRKGAFVVLESTNGGICPVKAMLEFMVDRRAGPGPFFMDREKVGLNRKEFVKEVKGALEREGTVQ